MHSLIIPAIPNSPLSNENDEQTFGRLSLRQNAALRFIENAAFDPDLPAYDDNYQNSQAFSDRFKDHMNSVLDALKHQFPKDTTAVEVGCGKGDFVDLMQSDGHFLVTGYDAAYEGENSAIEKRYLTPDDRLNADLVIVRHVLEHIPKPHEFLAMLKTVFGDAKIYIEVPDANWIIDNGVFFDITYEHVNYFSRQSLSMLFSNDPIAADGCFEGQYQFILADFSKLSAAFTHEYENGSWEPLNFDELFPSLNKQIDEIDRQLAQGRRGYVWGAGTKGCMFLVHCQRLNKVVDKIGFAVDVNPNKWDKFLPSSLVPIKSKDDLFEHASPNDLLIVANPNYFDEISSEVRESLSRKIEIVCL